MASTDSQSNPDLSPPATRAPLPPPRPAYLPTAGSPLTVDKDLYTKIQKAPRKQIEKFTIPIRSGQAWKCPAKSIVRISTPEGPQVGDLNIWNAKGTSHKFTPLSSPPRIPQVLNAPRPPRTLLELPQQATPPIPRLDLRPPLVLPPLHAAHGNHNRGHPLLVRS
jgi:hypothetical protein